MDDASRDEARAGVERSLGHRQLVNQAKIDQPYVSGLGKASIGVMICGIPVTKHALSSAF
jgi:hypothetical protein